MRNQELPALPDGFEYRLDLRHHVTPRLLKKQPVHRWFWFPHSFSPQLIDKILEKYPIGQEARILDPFVGAGTTVLRARELGCAAVGTDLSPLSIFVSMVKLGFYDQRVLQEDLLSILAYRPIRDATESLPERIRKAFTIEELNHILGLRQRIALLPEPRADFFRLVLLRVQQRLSRAVPDGGWFRWVEKPDQSDIVAALFEKQAALQTSEVNEKEYPEGQVFSADARCLENLAGEYNRVITSPPYPNRHDYSRIFHIELLSLGVEEREIKKLRKISIRSHVEANKPPVGVSIGNYSIPPGLKAVLDELPERSDPRIAPMLKGYFEDMYLTLSALYPHLRSGAFCAFVVGNVRHAGVMVPVDRILVEVGVQAGYNFETAWVARLRGNSAQQMGRFGREAARESIVFLRKH